MSLFYIKSQGSVTVILDGLPSLVLSSDPRYERLCQNLDNEDVVRELINAADTVAETLRQYGDVEVFNGHVKFQGEPLHNYLVDVILAAADPAPVAHFLDNVMRNPSRRAVEDLYKWCEKAQMPLTPDGCIVAYKLVRHDFKDIYSGTFDNSPGAVVEVPRNRVDEDPDRTCSHGLHFCSAGYLPYYGSSDSRIVLVKINPADVVAFPRDYNLAKARCCKYEVLEEIPREKLWPAENRIYEAPARYWIKDRDGDFVNFQDDGTWKYVGSDADAADWQTYTYDEATAHIATYTGCAEPLTIVPVATGETADHTVDERVQRIENQLRLDGDGLTLTERLDAIDEQLGLDEIEPLIARIERAESQLGLS